jgi:hypothetical protein
MNRESMIDACQCIYQNLLYVGKHTNNESGDKWVWERKHRLAELVSIVQYEMISEKVPAEMVRILFDINEEVNEVQSEMGDDELE